MGGNVSYIPRFEITPTMSHTHTHMRAKRNGSILYTLQQSDSWSAKLPVIFILLLYHVNKL